MAISCYLDSNVCVAYIQKPHIFNRESQKLLKNLRTKNISPNISPLCLDETTHILIRDGRNNNISNYLSITRQQIARLIKIPNLTIINPPQDKKSQLKIFTLINKYQLKPRDAYHLLTMKHHRIKLFATFDSDFDLVFSSRYLTHFQ